MPDIASLRLRAFSVKLSLRRIITFYHQLRAAKLMDGVPQASDLAAAPRLKLVFDEFRHLHSRMDSILFEETTRLSQEAEQAAHAYVRTTASGRGMRLVSSTRTWVRCSCV